jgi:glycosyltransferase involved in cell wall biosynthesis
MYALHQEMDVYLLTSRFEGFPLAIMEAMSCGVAIVATAVNGIPEHIQDERNGLLIYSKDDQAIVTEGLQHLKKLLHDSSLRKEIAANNHAYAQSHFSKEVFVAAYRKLFGLESENAS